MKIYKVKVNGKLYEVALEEVINQPNVSLTKENEPKVSAEKPSENKQATIVKAPMQGTILKVMVQAGNVVKKGESLFILEAMKMENEILSPVNGKVVKVNVNKGQTVNLNDLLVEIE